VPTVSTPDKAGRLTYTLRQIDGSPESAAAWKAIITRALNGDASFEVAIGDDKGFALGTEAKLRFEVPSSNSRALVSVGGIVAFIVVMALIGSLTRFGWLRDGYGVPESLVPSGDRSFSLARCQMLWWSAVVAASWLTIGWATDNWTSLNESSLLLMGIGAGTLAGAVAIVPDTVQRKLDAYKAALAGSPAGGAPTQALQDAEAALKGEPGIKSSGLVRDLVCDFGEGTGLHRVQVIFFALVYGVVFFWQAFHGGTMPIVPTAMLTLLGISSTAYVGFKLVNK
jgi:hypothetical protein